MLKYILWRIAAMVPTLFIISALVFTIIELPPGDFFESQIAELRAQGKAPTSRRSKSFASSTVSTDPRSSATSIGLAACFMGTSAIRSSTSCRFPMSSVIAFG